MGQQKNREAHQLLFASLDDASRCLYSMFALFAVSGESHAVSWHSPEFFFPNDAIRKIRYISNCQEPSERQEFDALLSGRVSMPQILNNDGRYMIQIVPDQGLISLSLCLSFSLSVFASVWWKSFLSLEWKAISCLHMPKDLIWDGNICSVYEYESCDY